MLVFDVGANVGAKAAEMRARGSQVVCFEPQPECVAKLKERFAGDEGVTIINKALGQAPGFAELFVCETANQLSTFSNDWRQGRFKDYSWSHSITTHVDTLDAAIAHFGAPDYCKIDVEGFELEVLAGLTRPIPLLSFEFCKEFLEKTTLCLDRLETIGFDRFNVSYGETHRFKFAEWMNRKELFADLDANRHPLAWGDIFAAPKPPDAAVLAALPADYRQRAADDLERLSIDGLAYPGVPLRLHLGCGETILRNYVNIDFPSDRHNVMQTRPDFEGDVTRLNFPDYSADEIRLHHVFEHFNRVVALGLLIRWQAWLKTGGRLHIETPDFLATAASALNREGAARMALVRHLEGDQAADWGYHIGQWYPERFERTLKALGFSNVAIKQSSTAGWHDPPLFNVTASATKKESVAIDAQIAAANAILRESTVHELERPTREVWCSQLEAFLKGAPPTRPSAHVPLSRQPEQIAGRTPTAPGALPVDEWSTASTDKRTIGSFRDSHYLRHNQRRQEHLASLGLPLEGRSVLELGAGIGDHTTFFIDRNCSVCVSEGRPELYELLRERYHWMRTELLDLEKPNPQFNDLFDVVYAYGVLYHLRDPAFALEEMSRWCGSLLLLETCVSTGDDLAVNLVSEAREDATQSVGGEGCRPTRPWIFNALRERFAHVYATVTQPWHPEFPLDWDSPAQSALMRAVFVASRSPLELPTLTSRLPVRQCRH
jgi:FkbM family methyltransferase